MITKLMLGALALVLAAGALASKAEAQELVFSGIPALKVYQEGTAHEITKLSAAEAAQRKCEIREIGGKYYWTSRESRELIRASSGAFTTFVAKDGSGYIRIVTPEIKKILETSKIFAADLMGNPQNFGYAEHLTFLLSSFTYYGATANLRTEEQ
jgi:hypothetical protein